MALPLLFATAILPANAQTVAPIGAAQSVVDVQGGVSNAVALAAFFDVKIDEAALQKSWDDSKTLAAWPRLQSVLKANKVPLSARRIALDELQKRGGVALLQLQAPAEFAIVEVTCLP